MTTTRTSRSELDERLDDRPDERPDERLDERLVERLDERLVEAATAALELFGVHLGRRLGLYAVLAEAGPATPAELAGRAGIAPRYAVEWLEQQAVAGLLAVDDVRRDPQRRRYSLPAEHVGPLLDAEDGAHTAPLASMVVGVAGVLDRVVEAYRTGAGVPYAAYGEAFRSGQGGINRPAFTHDLVGRWLPALPDVHRRLGARGARIADLGCGQGWSTIALARAYPDAEVVGLDDDEASITDAREHARRAGVDVRFEVADAADLPAYGRFDAVLLLEVLHDLARPVETLRSARGALVDGGSVVVVDEAVEPDFTAPGGPTERMMYGWSVSHCLPAALAAQPSAAIGTVLRPGQLAELVAEAGFGTFEVSDVDAGFFRVYRARV